MLTTKKITHRFVIVERIEYLCKQYDLPRFPLDQRTRGGLRVLYGLYEVPSYSATADCETKKPWVDYK